MKKTTQWTSFVGSKLATSSSHSRPLHFQVQVQSLNSEILVFRTGINIRMHTRCSAISLVSWSTGIVVCCEASRYETSGTQLSRRSRSSSWSLMEIPRTGPFSIRFIKCVMNLEYDKKNYMIKMIIPSNAVPHFFARDDGDLLTDSLVCVEIIGQSSVILLDYDSRCLLDCLCSDSTHRFLVRF
jgi:hypothetical protein